LSRYWIFGTSSRARFWPPLHGRRLRLDNSGRPLCHLRHKFFYSGGWAAASLSRLSHCLPVISFPLINRARRWNLLRELKIQASAYTVLQDKYSTTLLEDLTSCDVVSVTFNLLATRLRATLSGLLGGAGRLASRLVGGSSIRGTLGSPGWLNLDRSWNRSCSVSPSSSSDVSSMVTMSSPSPTSRRSCPCLCPPLEYPQVEEGKLGWIQTSSGHLAANSLGELDYYNTMSTRSQKFDYQPCLADELRSTRRLGRVCMVAYV
jgi:hypothetical protein